MAEIASWVAARYGLTIDDLRSEIRHGLAARARTEAYATISAELQKTSTVIARFFGRDPSTVARGIRSYERRRAETMAAE